MKSIPRTRPIGHSYPDLISVIQESASDLVEYQLTQDHDRFRFEKQKIALLFILILSLWVMFFFLEERIDDLRSSMGVPAGEQRFTLPPPDPVDPERSQPETSQFHYVI